MIKNFFLPLCLSTIMMSSCNNGANTKDAECPDNGNAAIENIMTRTSVRQYQADRTIPADTIEILLKAAMAAPTAINKQPWSFVVIDNRADLDSLAAKLPRAKMLASASIAIVPCCNLEDAIEGETVEGGYWIQDLSAATENLLLAAHALGLGAVWTGVYPREERMADVQKALQMPACVIPLCVVPIGYPVEPSTPKDKWKPEKVHYNKW